MILVLICLFSNFVKEGLPFAWNLSLTLQILTNIFGSLYFTHGLTSFFSVDHILGLCVVFYSVLSNIDQVLSINPSAGFSLETLTPIIRTILVELIDLENSVIIFVSQMTLLTWLTFLLGFQIVILIVLLLWIYFFLLTLVFALHWLSLHWEIMIMLSQFPLTFQQNHNRIPRFIT